MLKALLQALASARLAPHPFLAQHSGIQVALKDVILKVLLNLGIKSVWTSLINALQQGGMEDQTMCKGTAF